MNASLPLNTPLNLQTEPRLRSLDVFRGLTVLLMIVVNSPGHQEAFACLEHAAWNGCTLADLVFPYFLFILGTSLALTLPPSSTKPHLRPSLFLKITKRSLIIFSIGLLLNAFPHHLDLTTLRVYGVLQRIALCYFIAALLFITTTARTQIIIVLGLCFAYWLLMTQTFQAYTSANLTPENNLAAYVDRWLFSSVHLYGRVFDPEGCLSTLPAIATTLLGTLTGLGLRSRHTPSQKIRGMILIGVGLMVGGWVWGHGFPINKTLWSSSYVLWTGGLALLTFTACYWIIDVKPRPRGFKLLQMVGMNAMLAYVLHVFFLKVQAMITLTRSDGTIVNLRIFITEHLFPHFSLKSASLGYALSYTLLWITILSIYSSSLRLSSKRTWRTLRSS